MRRFRAELEPLSPSLFENRDDLVNKVMQSVHLAEATLPVSTIGLPDQLKDPEPILLYSSAKEEIEEKIQIVREARNATSILIDLEQEWWNTRLHLLAALAADYTDIRQLVFVGPKGRFVGMAAPTAVRRGLATVFRNVEIAYLQSIAMPGGATMLDPTREIQEIVREFRGKMEAMSGGERANIVHVTAVQLEQCLGRTLNTETLEVTGPGVTPALLHGIISRQSPFVALVQKGRLVRVVDCLALAESIAKTVVEGRINQFG